MKTVVGMFDTQQAAERGINELQARGYSRDEINILAKDQSIQRTMNDVRDQGTTTGATDNGTPEAAGAGAVTGTALGGITGLLVGLGTLAIPGIGPIVAAGTLATTIGTTLLGAGIGAGAGAAVGALVKAGVPEEEAHHYAKGFQQGHILLMVHTDDTRASEAESVLRQCGAMDINSRNDAQADRQNTPVQADNMPYAGGAPLNTTSGYQDTSRTTPVDQTSYTDVSNQRSSNQMAQTTPRPDSASRGNSNNAMAGQAVPGTTSGSRGDLSAPYPDNAQDMNRSPMDTAPQQMDRYGVPMDQDQLGLGSTGQAMSDTAFPLDTDQTERASQETRRITYTAGEGDDAAMQRDNTQGAQAARDVSYDATATTPRQGGTRRQEGNVPFTGDNATPASDARDRQRYNDLAGSDDPGADQLPPSR